mmetsp:Transcript_12329/g.15631  ORF Transcript_12329/g.15631 Transcript_12329/m.15631 type:complete len:156 (+) Transcript_12329:46-513(+)|eukprot:CAMPEP_0203663144 /NCGR_PEP_ID=MMETSP0090-20130426/848_1 /ASSEMBLY_ACC=CAM_ASM_001088 /TAXON_ID=426623 /ORGANISM="Chaetoceros affinis, Strain CCMP159" /LENGTH=155 /DNA_ID=CAMNT_0050526017 /DNA_START=135 /DNA_END=602 /DNA_ORIENTATION=+
MSVNEVKIKPPPFELEVKGTGHPSSKTYAIGGEDHTLGNALRHVLMQNASVEFAGYSVPHPSEPVVQIRVQTAGRKIQQENGEEIDTRLPATDVLKEACDTLIAQCEIVLDQVEEKMPEAKRDRMEIEDALHNEGYEGEEVIEDVGGDYDDEEMM